MATRGFCLTIGTFMDAEKIGHTQRAVEVCTTLTALCTDSYSVIALIPLV